MHDNDDANNRTPSTRWEFRKVKIREPAGGRTARGPQGRRWFLQHPRDMRKPLTVTVLYRGGAEAWWEIRARGQVIRRPGHVALHDVMRELHGER